MSRVGHASPAWALAENPAVAAIIARTDHAVRRKFKPSCMLFLPGACLLFLWSRPWRQTPDLVNDFPPRAGAWAGPALPGERCSALRNDAGAGFRVRLMLPGINRDPLNGRPD